MSCECTNVKAYLEITMKIPAENRPAAAKVYTDYRQPFLDTIEGALTKELLILFFAKFILLRYEAANIR